LTTGRQRSTKYTSNPGGNGTFTVTTIKGQNNKHLSITAAYIFVKKGNDIEIHTMHAQINTLIEIEDMKKNQIMTTKNPQTEAMKANRSNESPKFALD
jgi:hypothetical protein